MHRVDASIPLQFDFSFSTLDLFTRSVQSAANSVAIQDEYGIWTYSDLQEISDRVGSQLASKGVTSGTRVGIYGTRCASLVAALIGVWKAGAAAVLLDSAYPPARLSMLVSQAAPAAFIHLRAAGPASPDLVMGSQSTDGNGTLLLGSLPDEIRDCSWYSSASVFSQPSIEACDAAYVLFTSGSTGTPKGVITTHASLPHFLEWYVSEFRPAALDRFTMLSGLSHDPLMRDIFAPLTVGAKLLIPPANLFRMPRRLLFWMRSEGVTFTHLTPSLGRMFSSLARTQADLLLPDLRFVLFGGEPLRYSDVASFRKLAPAATVVNCYGATETPQIMAYHTIRPDVRVPPTGLVPLGGPIHDVQLLVMRRDGGLAEDGELGEICVRTKYLSKGYVAASAEQQGRFIRNPFDRCDDQQDFVYRTGDIGKLLPNSEIAFCGRDDNQVKIRGFRVELEEIESALRNCTGVMDAAVTVRSGDIEDVLCAFVQAEPLFDKAQCKAGLRGLLPEYMVPAEVVVVQRFPLTSNGKLDRRRLLEYL